MNDVIYQHKYPKIDMEELKGSSKSPNTGEADRLEYEEFKKKYLDKFEMYLDNNRATGYCDFVQAAINLSEWYELDILILHHKSHISVELTIDYCVSMRLFKPLFVLADEVTIIQGKDPGQITLFLDYYTHIVVSNGYIVRP